MESIELMTVVIILDLTQLPSWEDLPLIWKHKYYLPAGNNLVGVCILTDEIGSVAFNDVNWAGVEVAWTL